MPPLKRRYLILIVIIILILGIWSGRQQFIEFLAISSMSRAGLENIEMDMDQLGLYQTHLSRLGFVQQTTTGKLELDMRDASISYMPGELVNGHINKLSIDSLRINYEKKVDSQPESAEPRHELKPRILINAFRKALAEYVFFDALYIRSITLNGEPFAKLVGKTLSLSSNADNKAVQATLSVTELPHVVVVRLSKDNFELELQLAETIPAKLTLEYNETEAKGDYQLLPADLQAWLMPFVSFTGFSKTEAINGFLSVSYETDVQLNASFAGFTDAIAFEPYSANNVELSINLEYSSASTGSEADTDTQYAHQIKFNNDTYISAELVSAGDTSFSNALVNMAGTLNVFDDHWDYQGALNSNLLSATFNAQQINLTDFEARIIANAENVVAEGGFSPAALPGQFEFDINHNFGTGTGKFSLEPLIPLDLNAEGRQLSQLLTPWNLPFDLLSGNIQLATDASWSKDDAFRLNAEISFADIGGNIGEIVFSGLSFDHELVILPKLSSLQRSDIRINTVDSGVTLSNISTRFAVESAKTGPLPRVVLLDLEGEILGGKFSADGLVYDLNRSKNNLLIKASDIDLAEIVKTQQLEGITASGRLDGTLPIEINDAGIVIEQGSFNNSFREGTIRYRPEAGTDQIKQNRLAGIALDALRDFQYTHLQAGVNYTPEGMLGVSLELKGISPEVDAKRPVHLNINTEQNLISLLKSLRFAQGVSESIDNRVRRQYEKNHNN